MNVVNQRLHIDGIARVAVDRARVVASHAVVDVRPRAAVKLEPVVAGVTGVVVDYAAFERRVATCRNEVEDAVGGYRRLATNFDAEPVGLRLVKYRAGRIGVEIVGEGVGVGTVVIVGERSLRTSFGRCLYVWNPAVLSRLVGLPFAGAAAAARRQLGQDEADIAGG